MASTDAAFVLIHPCDNVLVCCRPAAAGDRAEIDGVPFSLPQAIGVGHKIARHALASGDKVIKYGVPIGSMTAAAETAQHVHSHNMKSDYLQSHTRDSVGSGGTAA
jgi:hypothetical protein